MFLPLVTEGLHRSAKKKLQKDILKRLDGCDNSGWPDSKDWITDCDAQEQVDWLIRRLSGELDAVDG